MSVSTCYSLIEIGGRNSNPKGLLLRPSPSSIINGGLISSGAQLANRRVASGMRVPPRLRQLYVYRFPLEGNS